MPKLGGAVGAKHSGKPTVIEHLIGELTSRGYDVGTIKEMVRIPTLDTLQTRNRPVQPGKSRKNRCRFKMA